MNQTFSITLFAAGLPVFLALATEMLSNHPTWRSLLDSPLGVVHLMVVGAAFVALVVGAIGIQLPRSRKFHGDRKEDDPDYDPPDAA